MQAAKKLVLVDEFDREYKRLQKPADAVAKTNSSLHLSNTLRNQSLSDDQKARVRCSLTQIHKHACRGARRTDSKDQYDYRSYTARSADSQSAQ